MLRKIYGIWYDLTDPYKHLQGLSLPRGLNPHLKSQMMKHQLIGTAWLNKHYGQGVILADDMGTGKTLTTLAYLDSTVRFNSVLVVAPPSLLHNWMDEIAKWAPNLKACVWQPSCKYSLDKVAENHDVVIISYNAMARYILETPTRWDIVIFDEAQLLKNHHTKRYKVADQINCVGKLALTGTPIENSLGDLYCLLNLVNPHLVQGFDRKSFNLYYKKRLPELKKLTREYVLAREKRKLRRLLGLPKKLHLPVHLTLSPGQKALYEKVATEGLSKLKNEEDFTRVHLFAMLGHLKMLCNDPRLIGLEGPSAKLDWLETKLTGWEEPVVLFSQYTKMLDLLEPFIKKQKGWTTYRLDGSLSSVKRAELITAWREDENPKKIFLISLRAGGTGLTLTESAIVVHFDTWWNPAVLDQASDRTYRLGQKRDVNIHTLTCRGTLEERIDSMIADKRALQSVIETQDEEAIKRIVLGDEPYMVRV